MFFSFNRVNFRFVSLLLSVSLSIFFVIILSSKMILMILGVSLAVLILLMLLACFLSWADQQFGGSASVNSGESSEVVSEMALAEVPR